MPEFEINRSYQVVGAGNVPYSATIQITKQAWAAADDQTKTQVRNILNSEPIPILSISGRGNGIKKESDGWTIHTQTNKRLYDRDRNHSSTSTKTFTFDEYRKSPH